MDGCTFGLRSNDESTLAEMESLVPLRAERSEVREVDFLVSVLRGKAGPRKGVRHFHLVYDAWIRVLRTLDWEEVAPACQETLLRNLAVYSQQFLYIRGSLYEFHGRAVLVPAADPESELTLQRAGARPCSSEFTLLRQDGTLHSFVAPSREALRPGAIFLDGEAPAGPLSAGRATLSLIPRVFQMRRQPARTLPALSSLARQSITFAGLPRSAEQLSGLLQAHLAPGATG